LETKYLKDKWKQNRRKRIENKYTKSGKLETKYEQNKIKLLAYFAMMTTASVEM